MTDDKKKPPGTDAEPDWDSALDEWEKAFVPEVAEDKDTKKPATLQGPPAPQAAAQAGDRPSRPLYRPPVPGAAAPPRRFPEAARPAAHASPPRPASPARPAPGVSPPPRPGRAGLSQLFGAKPAEAREPDEIDVLLGAGDERERTEIADLPPAREAQTSAIELQTTDVELIDAAATQTDTPAFRGDEEADPFRAPMETSPGESDEPKPGPPVLAPEARRHDPDVETSIAARPRIPQAEEIEASLVDTQTAPHATAPAASPYEEEATKFYVPQSETKAEKTGRAWIADESREAYELRAAWLESEARVMENNESQARALLAVSEIRALLGQMEAAERLATQARDLLPSSAFAHRQARGLLASRDPSVLSEAFDTEARNLTAVPLRVHALLLAADLRRTTGDDEGAASRWQTAAGLAGGDARTSLALAALAVAKGDPEAISVLRKTLGPGPISEGLAAIVCLRRGPEDRTSEAGGEPVGDAIQANDALRRSREALDAGDVATAARAIAELGKIEELAPAARWFAAALGVTRSASRGESAAWLKELVAAGETSARRPLAACAIELGDASLLATALEGDSFSVADRAVLRALLGSGAEANDSDLAALAETEALVPLASAIEGTRPPPADESARASWLSTHGSRVAGQKASRTSFRLARLVAGGASTGQMAESLADTEEQSAEAAAIGLLAALEEGRDADVSDALRKWEGTAENDTDAVLLAGLVAERAGDTARSLAAYREVRGKDPANEGVLRAMAYLDPALELAQELNELADHLGEGIPAAVARLEAVVREQTVDDATKLDLLERAHRAAPQLPIASFLGERLARRTGEVEAVLEWIRARQPTLTDPLERALDAVREALLVADQDPEFATQRLADAHAARTSDVALRELYERLAREPPSDRGPWREQRAAIATGDAKALYYMEAAHEYERAGDKTSALRASEAAVASGDSLLARSARARAEVEGGHPERLADELLTFARSTDNARERREAYERLADLDATGRADSASALLWHRSILEEFPDHKPSLRHIEHALISEGRSEELEPIAASIARSLALGGDEGVAHADLAARLRAKGAAGDWDSTLEMAEIGARAARPSLFSLRLLSAHGRARKDDKVSLATAEALLARATRPPEVSALLVRAADAAARLGSLDQARELLERAKAEDPGDVVTWAHLAEIRKKGGDVRGAAEAYESLARTSNVPAHQLDAWYDAARTWSDAAHDEDRAVLALEQAAAVDVTHKDVFPRLSALYATRGSRAELAQLLERRIASITDPAERVEMEVERGRALAEVGELVGAREALKAALEANPDHTLALATFADLSAKQEDWDTAEQAWVRLARLLATPEEQREIYARLGELYSVHSLNLPRAELAFKEVLKRAPGDVTTLEQLVNVYKRQNDATHAAEIMQLLITQAKDPVDRRRRLVELAAIHEAPGHDVRKAEQVLESARREAPTDVNVLRALAEFYIRHKQMPAVQILLDRAAADARRAFAAGRFAPNLFEVMRAVFELRGKKDASQVVAATLSALDAHPSPVRGGDARALDPRLDDLLAPEVLSPALRALLAKTGDALDAAAPLDLRALQATQLTSGPMAAVAASLAASVGLSGIQLFVSTQLGHTTMPIGSSPPGLVLGSDLVKSTDDPARAFLLVRALKLLMTRSSALVRAPAAELPVVVSAWLQALAPSWAPQGLNPAALANASRRIAGAMPKRLDPDVGMMALEVAGSLGPQAGTLGASALGWANRAALLAVGDPSAALDAIAWSHGSKEGAPKNPKDRATWVGRTPEAKDLLAFSVSDAYAEARSRLGLDK